MLPAGFGSSIFFIAWLEAVGMWAKGSAVGNAQRCPRSCPVRRRRIVHMSIARRARSARPPRLRTLGEAEIRSRLDGKGRRSDLHPAAHTRRVEISRLPPALIDPLPDR